MAEASPIESALDALRGYDPSSQSDHRAAAMRAVRLAAEFVANRTRPQRVELERRAAVLDDLTGRDSALRKALHALGEQLEEVLRPFRRPDGTLPSFIAWDLRTHELVEVVKEVGPFPHVKAQVRTSDGEGYSARRIPQGMLISRQLGDNILATRLDQLIRMITDEKTDALDLLGPQGELDSLVDDVAPAISNPDTVATWRRELESAQLRLTMELPIGSALLLQCHEVAFAPQPQEAYSEAVESRIVSGWGAVQEAAAAICRWSEAAILRTRPSQTESACPVQLDAPGKPVRVLGKPKELTSAQYNVVQTLVEAYPNTVTKDHLANRSGHVDAVNTLKRLARKDDTWAKVIKLAGRTGGGYGLTCPVDG